jgi:hypothetical protein
MASVDERRSNILPLPRGPDRVGEGSGHGKLEQRVFDACRAALAEDKLVTPIGMLGRLGWLQQSFVDQWRQGRLDYLEGAISTKPAKVSLAFRVLDTWARSRGLTRTEGDYISRARDRRPLCFSSDPTMERAYRTHWVSADLSEKGRERVMERANKAPDLVVISPVNDWKCAGCGGTGDFLFMEDRGPLCLRCADMDHLVYLPSGDAKLSRRAKAASGLSAVVVRFSRARRRYERQGVLVEKDALARAEAQCRADVEKGSRG